MKRQKRFEILFIFLISLTPLLWLRGGEVIIGHDSGFYLDPVERVRTYLYAWLPGDGFGVDYSFYRGFLLAMAPQAFFGFLTGSLAWAQGLTFIFWFFVMGISMYFFAAYVLPQKRNWPFRIIASTMYVYNFYILQAWLIAERAKFSLYAALPLVLFFLLKTIRGEYKILKGAFLCSLTLFFLNGGGALPNYGFLVLALIVFAAFFVVRAAFKRDLAQIFRIIKTYALFFLGFVFVNFYWIYPVFRRYLFSFGSEVAARGGIGSQIDWIIEISKNTSYFNLLRLQGVPDWYDNLGHSFSSWYLGSQIAFLISLVPIISLFWVFYKLVFIKIRSKKINEIVYFTLVLMIVSLIFTAGAHPPLGRVYLFFIKYLPGFVMFRNPFYKFGGGFWFSYIILFSFFANSILNKKIFLRVKNYASIFLIVGILMYHYPYFASDIFRFDEGFSTKLKLPEYVYDTSRFVSSSLSKDARILLLPPLNENTLVDTYDWGFYSLDNLPKSLFNRSVITNSGKGADLVAGLYGAIEKGDGELAREYFRMLGITHVLWREDVIGSYEFTNEDFAKLEFVSEIFKSGRWSLYEITEFFPRIYFADNPVFSNARPEFVLEKENFSGTFALAGFNDIDLGLETLVVRPECSGCDFNRGFEKSEFLFIPEIKYKPGSIQYRISRYLENRRIATARTYSDKIDALLVSMARRVGEMRDFGKTSELEYEYERLFFQLIDNFNKLDSKEKIFYSQRVIEYMEHFLRFDRALTTQLDAFEPFVWDTNDYENIKMVVDVPVTDTYEIRGVDGEALEINGFLVNGQNIFLEEGVQRLDVRRSRPENLVFEKEAHYSGDFRYRFSLPDIDVESAYLITFQYQIISDEPVWLLVENGQANEELKLISGGLIELSHLFAVTEKPSLYFFTKSGNDFELELKNVYLSEFYLPQIYFYREGGQSFNNIKADYEYLSPVKHRFSVENASKNAILVFSESYDPAWQLKGASANHIMVNGYSNGWIIDEPLNGEYEIYYGEQGGYEVGSVVSVFGVIVSLLVLIIF